MTYSARTMTPRILVLVAVLVAAGAVHAKPAAKRADAQRHYDAAIAHYKAGEYDPAVEEFEAGYALRPEPQYLFNLGQASRLGHHSDKALDYYKQYLAALPEAPNRAAVEQRIAEVQKELEAARPKPEPVVAPPPERTPAPAAASAPVEKRPLASDEPSTPYQLGARIRGIFVTQAMLSPFLVQSTSLESVSVGIEFVYRRPKYDVVTSLDFSWLDVHDGNYLAVNHPPDTDTQFTQFKNLSFISADVSIIGHSDVTRWLELRYGGGLGLGIVLGDVLLTHDSGDMGVPCTVGTAGNLAACHPIGVDLTSPQREQQLKATENGATKDTSGDPHRHITSDTPPVMGVVNLLVGARFKLPKKWTAQVEVGFRDAIFVGAGVHYLF